MEAIRDLGAELSITGNSYDEAYAAALRTVEEENRVLVPPFDDPFVISGQGTIGLEILKECPEIGSVIVPVSGGGTDSGHRPGAQRKQSAIFALSACQWKAGPPCMKV